MTHDEKFLKYEDLLCEWSGRMNLVAPSTLGNIRERHINDSIQTIGFIDKDSRVIDLGSGAGFPAAVLAIKGLEVFAIESIGKKCAFLNELKSRLDLPNLTVMNDRIENTVKRITDNGKLITITARAFASLEKILDMTFGIPADYVLLKGERAMDEIKAAQTKYKFDYELIPSVTGPGFVLIVKNVKKAGKRKE